MRLIATCLLLCISLYPQARAEQLVLGPASGRVEMRAYGLGLFPADGNFTRFHGVMRYDPAQPKACQVMLEIDPSSLRMATEEMTERVTGARFMDVERYGETHPFELDLQRSGRHLTVTGRLRRREWGITADPITVGATIRIRIELTLTAEGDHT
jgi:polyisoprenoid-binding protein YceI